jgi:Secretion system C-terminal sorting domain
MSVKKELNKAAKVIFCLLVIVSGMFQTAAAQCNWQSLGYSDFDQVTYDSAKYTSLAVDRFDISYVAFRDAANGSKASVRKYVGNKWVNVGLPGFSAGIINSISLQLDSGDVPYVLFKDAANGNKATVMKFNGVTWVIVGQAGFSAGEVNYAKLRLNSQNKLYVAYSDVANGDKTTMMKFANNVWSLIGSAGFSFDAAYDLSFDIDTTGTPYLVFKFYQNAKYLQVLKFNGNNWVAINGAQQILCGSAMESPYLTGFMGLRINKNNEIYLAYRGASTSGFKANVKKFNGTSWSSVGAIGFSTNLINKINIEFDTNDLPSVIFEEVAPFNKIVSMKFDGVSWINNGGNPVYNFVSGNNLDFVISHLGTGYVVSADIFSPRTAFVVNFTNNTWKDISNRGLRVIPNLMQHYFILDNNGVPHIAYTDGTANYQTRVARYVGNNWQILGTLNDTIGSAAYLSLTFDANNQIYISYTNALTKQLNVKKFNGLNWVSVGSPNFSIFFATYTKITIDKFGAPYVMYVDNTNGGSLLKIIKYNGSNWVTLGTNNGFSNIASYLNYDIKTDSLGVPNIVFSAITNNSLTSYIKKWNGSSSWINVPLPVNPFPNIDEFHLEKDNSGNLYFSYIEPQNNFNAKVFKLHGTNWQLLSSGNLSPMFNYIEYVNFRINKKTGTPYYEYMDYYNNRKTEIVVFNGNTWKRAVTYDTYSNTLGDLSIEIDKDDNIYFLYFINGGFVKKFHHNAIAFASNTFLCPGSNVTLTAIGGQTYSWSGPNGFSSANPSVVLNNLSLSQSGNYNVAISDSVCGTVVKQVNVTVNPTYAISVNTSICNGDSLLFNGIYYKSAVTTLANLLSSKGCDSLVTLNLSIKQPSTSIDTKQACNKFTWLNGVTYTASNTTAQFILQNAAGCDSTITLNLTLDSVNTLVSTNDTVLSANAIGVKYQWINCSNGKTIIVGDTNQSFTATSNGSYAVIVNKNGCIDTSACVTINSVGLSKINLNKQLRIHPNPSSGQFTIEATHEGLLIISDAIGRELIKVNVVSGSNQIDLSQYANGIYVAKFNSKSIQGINRLIISK